MPANNEAKLEQLAEIAEMSIDEMLAQGSADSLAQAICTRPECDYTIELEPDQDRGWCGYCNTNTVQSCLVLYGII